MNKFKERKVSRLPIDYHGKPVVQANFSGKFTKQEIREYAQKQSDKFKTEGKKGMISVALEYDNGWKSGYISSFGDNISLYSLADSGDDVAEEQEYFDNFVIYILKG